jgi:hypothetical protein
MDEDSTGFLHAAADLLPIEFFLCSSDVDPTTVLDNILCARAHTHEHQMELITMAAAKMVRTPWSGITNADVHADSGLTWPFICAVGAGAGVGVSVRSTIR